MLAASRPLCAQRVRPNNGTGETKQDTGVTEQDTAVPMLSYYVPG